MNKINPFRQKLRRILNLPGHLFHLPGIRGKEKIFVISMQRTGTTSVGRFLEDMGYRVAHESDGVIYNWNGLWESGNFERIFNSAAFQAFQAFEDAPWWYPDFYKILHHRFPGSKFIMLTRDSDQWFDSLVALKGGRTPGNTRRHCKIYGRMSEYYQRLNSDPDFHPSFNQKDELMQLEHMRDHYISVYETYNREVVDFFEQFSPGSLFTCRLEDENKWQKMGRFIGKKVPEGYDIHANRTAGSSKDNAGS